MRQAVNILFLGGAKRVSMARMFKNAGAQLGMEVNLFSYELRKEVPVAEEATIIEGLRWNDADIMADIHGVVIDNRIDIIVPFVDAAIEVAAKYCKSDGECYSPTASPEIVKSLYDKIAGDELFRKHKLPVPRCIADLFDDDKVIAKPRYGSASKGIQVIDKSEAEKFDRDKYLLQEFIADAEEFTVDCFVSKRGQIICAVPRRRLEVVGGEVSSTITVRDAEIEDLARMTLDRLKLTGAVTIQILRQMAPDGKTKLYLMEINPRLGGGAVCSVHAGANLPGFILAEWAGAPMEVCDNWKNDTMIVRYMQEVVFQKR